nr:hypothetical protein [Tanacetum cinerariifolium]
MEDFTPDVRAEISVLLLQMMDRYIVSYPPKHTHSYPYHHHHIHHQMERYNQTFKRTCERGDLVLRTSCKPYSYGKQYYACPYSKLGTQDRGCGYFMWMDDLRLHISSSSGSSTPPSYSPGTSTRPSYSPGSSTRPSYSSSGSSTPPSYSPGTSTRPSYYIASGALGAFESRE